MNFNLNKPLVATVSLCLMVAAQGAVAQDIDFGKAEETGNQVIGFLRGPAATIAFVMAFAIAGFLASFNRISWAWPGAICLGAFFVFGGPSIVDSLRSILS